MNDKIIKKQESMTNLVLAFPVLQILDVASPADIHESSGPDKNIVCRHNIRNRRLARILPRHPDGHRYVVRRAPK